MKKLIIIGSIFLTSLAFSVGQNVNGTSGYVVMPTADGLRFQEYSLGMSAFSGTNETKSHGKFYGALGTAEGSELSVMGRSEREGMFLNLKWFGALNNYTDPLMVGIGFENISSLGTYGDYPNVFMVVTKKLAGGHSFSVGSTGRYINKEMLASMLIGFEVYSTESLAWLADWSAYEDNRYNMNVGLRIYSSSTMYFTAKVLNALKNNVDPDAHPTVATIGMTITGFM